MMHLFAQKRREFIAKSNVPEQPLIKCDDMPVGTRFTFVDFVPSYRGTDPNSGKPTYHSFGELVTFANVWLRTLNDWELINCETGITSYWRDPDLYCVSIWERQTRDIFQQRGLGIKEPSGTYVESALFVLRLWMKKKISPSASKVNLSYADFEPQRLGGDDFEPLDHVVSRMNQELLSCESCGRIINIETVNITSETRDFSECDPESVLCGNSSEIQGILQFVRVYFNDDQVSKKILVGFKDFVPDHLSGGVILKPEYESFSDISDKAMLWLAQDPDLIFISAETRESPMKSRSSLDTKKMRHFLAKSGLDYIRYIRIWYGKELKLDINNGIDELQGSSSMVNEEPRINYFASKIVSTKHTGNLPLCITINQTKNTVAKWFESESDEAITIRGGNFIELFPKSKFDVKDEIENCYQAHNMFINRQKYLAAQIYFDVGPERGIEKIETIKREKLFMNDDKKAVRSVHCIMS